MKNIETSVTINAPVSRVWEVLMDFNSYKDWNPFLDIEGGARVGNHLVNTITVEGMKPQVFKPSVLTVKEQKEFRWKGKLLIRGLFDGEHYFILESKDDNRTLLLHGEYFSGILVGLLWRSIGDKTLKGFEAMNTALKARCED